MSVEQLREELRRSQAALASSQMQVGVLSTQLNRALSSHGSQPSVPPSPTASSATSRSPTEKTTVALSSVKHLNDRGARLGVQVPLQRAPPSVSGSERSIRSIRSESARQNPLSQVASFFQKIIDPDEARREERRLGSAILIQAIARGADSRRTFRWRREISASVLDARVMEGPGKRWGTIYVPAYVITVVRGPDSWTVEHRYSDWRELARALRRYLPAPPPVPSKLPFRGRREIALRKPALHSYLQQLLEATDAKPLARKLLVDFLRRSHQNWKYAF